MLRLHFANTNRQRHTHSGRLLLKPFNLQPLPIQPRHPPTTTTTSCHTYSDTHTMSNITLNHFTSEAETHQETEGGLRTYLLSAAPTKLNTQITSFTNVCICMVFTDAQGKHTQKIVGLMARTRIKRDREEQRKALAAYPPGGTGGAEHARQMRKNFFPQTSLGMCYVPVKPTSFLKHLVCIAFGRALPEHTDERARTHTHTHTQAPRDNSFSTPTPLI